MSPSPESSSSSVSSPTEQSPDERPPIGQPVIERLPIERPVIERPPIGQPVIERLPIERPLTEGAPIELPLCRLDPDLPVPAAGRSGDAAVDLPARYDLVLEAGERRLVPTGFAVAIPVGYCGLVLPRSGLALRHGVTLVNSPGLIDAGYRGELQVILLNTGTEPVTLRRGDRIAQLLVQSVPRSVFSFVSELPPPIDSRGDQGFGSSGQ